MPAPPIVLDLVERFKRNRDEYRASGYKEDQLRAEFLDPFFEALGWDLRNTSGAAEAYKDVVHEDALKIGQATEAPDYCFRIGGTRKFFVEAKKPSVDIREGIDPAYQIRRYAWSAKLPVSILTDFEELAVYDCRVKPHVGDKAATARIMLFTYEQYAEKWDEIASIFSKDAILKGAFDRFAESGRGRRGTATVDEAFLEDIEGWRRDLARDLARENPRLSNRELNYTVGKTIDRIIFLRIAEDRGLETLGRLQALQNGARVYPRLVQIFREADERYNSGLFHFRKEDEESEAPDELTPGLKIDDDILKRIIKSLYYPDSPYEFSVLPTEILGQVYEQFLGQVIRLTEGHNAKVEEKPEVKKAGGVYYTPSYIVDYIVRNTVGKLVEGKTPRQVASDKRRPPLRVLDPACGSGSFLIGAYQFLLDWYRDRYIEEGAEKHRAELYQGAGGVQRLTIAERKRILLDHIYGVDIDPQAVEVTKLSLLLKVLEGETRETLGTQRRLWRERALPDLGANIKCGNSLIGPDFYEGKGQKGLFGDEEERYRVNAFDWKAEFAEVLKVGGFDVVIGNPPYIRIQTMQDSQSQEADFFSRSYKAASQGNYDIYIVFVERGLSLLNQNGKIGFILPNKFFNAQYGQPLRKVLSDGKHLEHIVHFGDQQVFSNATTYTCLLFLGNGGSRACDVIKVSNLKEWRRSGVGDRAKLQENAFTAAEWNIETGAKGVLRSRLPRMGKPLGEIAHLFVGLQTSADRVYVLPDRQGLEQGILKPFLTTGGLHRYAPAKRNAWLVFPYNFASGKAELMDSNEIKTKYPRAWNYLSEHRDALMDRDNGKMRGEGWHGYVYPKNLCAMEDPKLIIQVTSKEPTVILDENGLYMTGGGAGPFYGIRPFPSEEIGLKFLLGILNSKVFGWIVRTQSTPLRGGYFKYSKQYIETTPIPQSDKAAQDRIVKLVEQMLELRKQIIATRTPQGQAVLERQIAATGTQIDRLVYDLYGLTEEEVRIVEGGKSDEQERASREGRAGTPVL